MWIKNGHDYPPKSPDINIYNEAVKYLTSIDATEVKKTIKNKMIVGERVVERPIKKENSNTKDIDNNSSDINNGKNTHTINEPDNLTLQYTKNDPLMNNELLQFLERRMQKDDEKWERLMTAHELLISKLAPGIQFDANEKRSMAS